MTEFVSVAGLRLELAGLWSELQHCYGATILSRAQLTVWDFWRLRVEVAWAETRLAALAEGVRSGWLPAEAKVAVEELVA